MCRDREAQKDAKPHQPLPGEPGHVRPLGAFVRDASGDLRPVAELPVSVRRGRLLLQNVPLRDGMLRLDSQRHRFECGEIHRCGSSPQNPLLVDKQARQAGHHHRLARVDDLCRPEYFVARHFLPTREDGGVGHLHRSEAPVDL